MSLNAIETDYLTSCPRGVLATVTSRGAPQAKPVGFRYNPELGTIDIAGYGMGASAKYRNVRANPSVAFVVEDAFGEGAAGMRFLEIRGTADTAVAEPADAELGADIIRVHPHRVVGWNIDPHRPGLYARTVA